MKTIEKKVVNTVKTVKTRKPTAPSLKTIVYDISGTEVEKITLPKNIFAVDVSPQLLAQYVRVYLANQHSIASITKTRGEVVGSTRKIYRQKGTGRARHGDRKAPIFVGGGVAHGPRGGNRTLKINQKQKKKALFGALSIRFKNNDVVFVKGLDTIEPKTKLMQQAVKNLKIDNQRLLFITLPKKTMTNAILAARNLASVSIRDAMSVNAYDVLKPKKLLFCIEALELFTKHYVN